MIPSMEKMRAMVLSQCAKIETNPLKLTEIDRHEIKIGRASCRERV